MADTVLYDCVKVVNDTYRTALMNRMYYGHRLSIVKRWNLLLEIFVAIGTSSAIGAWTIWKSTAVGEHIWPILAGVSTLLAVIKPFLNLSKHVEKYTKLFVGHGDVYYDLRSITADLVRCRDYTDKMHEAFVRALGRIKQLAPDDDPKISEKLSRRFFEEVKKQVPVESLWWPE